MDPITVLGAVPASAQLAGTTSNLCIQLYRYYCGVKGAPENSKELCDEISDLSDIITGLAHAVKMVEETSDMVVIKFVSVESLQNYSQFLGELSSRIHVNKNDIKKKLKWPLSTKDNEQLITKVERYK